MRVLLVRVESFEASLESIEGALHIAKLILELESKFVTVDVCVVFFSSLLA